ncbi:hypothetical protein [Aliivibrio fischeri]|uniref:hypothetical protein n=1 Tax=Aliivibrio fischeri TaxID=668 RepID=UPI0012D98F1F|nr:hypothetical protein [Aliivibrio fischeri]MUJ20407.1 hypothetical protein [Aliivibrio fischeri]
MSHNQIISISAGLFTVYVISVAIKQSLVKRKRKLNNRVLVLKARKNATERLLAQCQYIPNTKSISLILINRLLVVLRSLLILSDKKDSYQSQVASLVIVSDRIKREIRESPYRISSIISFKVPTDTKQAIMLLRLTKELGLAIKHEYSKGRITSEQYRSENKNLSLIRLMINAENLISRAHASFLLGKSGSAIHILDRGIEYLGHYNNEYAIITLKYIKEIRSEIINIQKMKHELKAFDLAMCKSTEVELLFSLKRDFSNEYIK